MATGVREARDAEEEEPARRVRAAFASCLQTGRVIMVQGVRRKGQRKKKPRGVVREAIFGGYLLLPE